MTLILPTDRPVLYTAHGRIVDEDVVVSDTTQVGDSTGIAGVLAVVSDEDEAAFIGALVPMADAFPSLPDSGWLETGDIYAYGGGVVMVRQSHDRMHYAPSETPALFWTVNSSDEWIAGEQVSVGTRRRYEGVLYEAIQGHTTESTWTPPETPTLWAVVDEGTGTHPWQSDTTYELGAEVTHNDATWESRRNNNVWEPGTNDSGWLRIDPYPAAWYYLGGEGYPLDWEVTHNGQTWRNTIEGNHYDPGVWGWEQV
jgi:hypothetical protein